MDPSQSFSLAPLKILHMNFLLGFCGDLFSLFPSVSNYESSFFFAQMYDDDFIITNEFC